MYIYIYIQRETEREREREREMYRRDIVRKFFSASTSKNDGLSVLVR